MGGARENLARPPRTTSAFRPASLAALHAASSPRRRSSACTPAVPHEAGFQGAPETRSRWQHPDCRHPSPQALSHRRGWKALGASSLLREMDVETIRRRVRLRNEGRYLFQQVGPEVGPMLIGGNFHPKNNDLFEVLAETEGFEPSIPFRGMPL